jgi:hypothetical protein
METTQERYKEKWQASLPLGSSNFARVRGGGRQKRREAHHAKADKPKDYEPI